MLFVESKSEQLVAVVLGESAGTVQLVARITPEVAVQPLRVPEN